MEPSEESGSNYLVKTIRESLAPLIVVAGIIAIPSALTPPAVHSAIAHVSPWLIGFFSTSTAAVAAIALTKRKQKPFQATFDRIGRPLLFGTICTTVLFAANSLAPSEAASTAHATTQRVPSQNKSLITQHADILIVPFAEPKGVHIPINVTLFDYLNDKLKLLKPWKVRIINPTEESIKGVDDARRFSIQYGCAFVMWNTADTSTKKVRLISHIYAKDSDKEIIANLTLTTSRDNLDNFTLPDELTYQVLSSLLAMGVELWMKDGQVTKALSMLHLAYKADTRLQKTDLNVIESRLLSWNGRYEEAYKALNSRKVDDTSSVFWGGSGQLFKAQIAFSSGRFEEAMARIKEAYSARHANDPIVMDDENTYIFGMLDTKSICVLSGNKKRKTLFSFDYGPIENYYLCLCLPSKRSEVASVMRGSIDSLRSTIKRPGVYFSRRRGQSGPLIKMFPLTLIKRL